MEAPQEPSVRCEAVAQCAHTYTRRSGLSDCHEKKTTGTSHMWRLGIVHPVAAYPDSGQIVSNWYSAPSSGSTKRFTFGRAKKWSFLAVKQLRS